MADAIARFRRRDGRLAGIFPLVSYVPGDEVVILDGEFTPAALRAIAAHMERLSTPVAWPYLVPVPRGG
jgi:hypothetical protein